MASQLTQFNASQPRYTSDGKGRDTYIFHNNGGFDKNVSLSHLTPNYNQFRGKQFYNCRRNVAPLKYRSDGTGRDSYILKEHGGLEREFKSLREHNFKDFLRVPNSMTITTGSIAKTTNNSPMARTIYVSQDQLNRNNTIKQIEKNVVKRLYWKAKPKLLVNTAYYKYDSCSPFLV
jgi:hypothetical protein